MVIKKFSMSKSTITRITFYRFITNQIHNSGMYVAAIRVYSLESIQTSSKYPHSLHFEIAYIRCTENLRPETWCWAEVQYVFAHLIANLDD